MNGIGTRMLRGFGGEPAASCGDALTAALRCVRPTRTPAPPPPPAPAAPPPPPAFTCDSSLFSALDCSRVPRQEAPPLFVFDTPAPPPVLVVDKLPAPADDAGLNLTLPDLFPDSGSSELDACGRVKAHAAYGQPCGVSELVPSNLAPPQGADACGRVAEDPYYGQGCPTVQPAAPLPQKNNTALYVGGGLLLAAVAAVVLANR